jgi:single-strand DNA-binding protein
VGRDVETRETSGGDTVANVSLAFTYGRKGDDGKRPTQWVDGVLWGKRADALAQYLVKGQKVVVSLADVAIETYTTRDGDAKSKLVGKIEDIELAGKPKSAEDRAPAPAPAPKQKPAAKQNNFDDDLDGDIPF